MKQYDVKIDETDLSCTICLNSFYEPITIKCGHTFCVTCIHDCRPSCPSKINNNFIHCPLCREKILSSEIFECSENKFIKSIVKKCKLTRVLNDVEQKKLKQFENEKKIYFEEKRLKNNKKINNPSTCNRIYTKIEGYVSCIALLILLLVVFELLAQVYLVTTRVPNLIDYKVDENNIIVSSSIRSDDDDDKNNNNNSPDLSNTKQPLTSSTTTTGKRKNILNGADRSSSEDQLMNFFIDATGNIARESFLPPNYMIVMLSYLDRLLLNNTFSGLALEAVMTDPIPNIINATKQLFFGGNDETINFDGV